MRWVNPTNCISRIHNKFSLTYMWWIALFLRSLRVIISHHFLSEGVVRTYITCFTISWKLSWLLNEVCDVYTFVFEHLFIFFVCLFVSLKKERKKKNNLRSLIILQSLLKVDRLLLLPIPTISVIANPKFLLWAKGPCGGAWSWSLVLSCFTSFYLV